jgi:hypothetical protein
MNCKRCRSQIYDLLDESLSAAEAARIRKHMDGCAECRQFWRDETKLAELMHRSAELSLRHYRGTTPAVPAGLADTNRAWFRRYAWGAAAAAAFLILGLGGYFLLRSHGGGASGSTAASNGGWIETPPRIQVISVELQGKPAKPFIYQTPKASFIWIAPSKDIGG